MSGFPEPVVVFVITLMCCLLILATKPLHILRTSKGHNGTAVQSAHKLPTPRIGGVAIALGLTFGSLFFLEHSIFLLLLLMSTLPVFIGGLGEDLGFDVSPKRRLILSFLSALTAGVSLGVWIPYTGLTGLDYLFGNVVFAAAFTILLSGGISHSLNLIDGLNGLALGVSIAMGIGLIAIAVLYEDWVMSQFLAVFVAALAGLFVVNFPFGKLFLGDAGAYSLGHLLTWSGIVLLNRHEELAPFSIFLIFFWPSADMIFAIIRRRMTGKPIDKPDRLHFHQLVMRAIEMTLLSKEKRYISNPLATVIVIPLASIPIVCAVVFAENNLAGLIGLGIFSILFWLTYVFGMFIARRFARS